MSRLLVQYNRKKFLKAKKNFIKAISLMSTQRLIKLNNLEKSYTNLNCYIAKIENTPNGKSYLKINFEQFENISVEIIGEIFNSNDLRNFLLSKKINIKENINLEKIIAFGYIYFGYSFFERLEGEFSLIIYDKKNNELICVRDRYGTNLIFYHETNSEIILSSEIKSIISFPNIKKNINFNSLSTFLFKNYRYSFSEQETFFNEIKIIPPNTIYKWSMKKLTKNTLWHFKIECNLNIDLKSAKRKFIHLLNRSLELRDLNENKNKAYLISGGLDSPTIATLAAEKSNKKNIGYSLCFNNPSIKNNELSYDESFWIKEIVKKNKIDWRPIYITNRDLKSNIDDMFKRHDEPVSTPTWISHYILCKNIAKDKIKILYGGDGGDHALAGLYDDFPYYFADLYKNKKFNLLNDELEYWSKFHNHTTFTKNLKIWDTYKKKCFDWKKPGEIKDYSWDEEKMRNLSIYDGLKSNFLKNKRVSMIKFPSVSNSYLISKLWQDLLFTSSPPSSRAEDINFSTFRLNLRSVFLDKNFMEFCWSLPGHMMIKNGMTKYLMRYSMKNKLPNVVINKKEHHGLNSPANEWFRGLLNKEIVNSIEVLSSKKYNFINRNKALKILNDHYENKCDNMMILWKFYSTANWIKKWKF